MEKRDRLATFDAEKNDRRHKYDKRGQMNQCKHRQRLPRRPWARQWVIVTGACLALAVASPRASMAAAEDATPNAEAVRERWLGRLDGRRFSARMVLRVERGGRTEERTISVWRDDQAGQRERLMARFETPFDMRGFAILYLENSGRANDYFVYQPELRRIRRVAESLARQDVYGVDLEYLGFGLAVIEQTEVTKVEEASLGGTPTVRLTERAVEQNQRFDQRVVWLDPKTWIPLRTEHHRNGEIRLVAATEEIRAVQGVPTPIRVAFDRPQEGERVVMHVEQIDYEAPIPEVFFTTMELLKGR
jgi:hypothetical protein